MWVLKARFFFAKNQYFRRKTLFFVNLTAVSLSKSRHAFKGEIISEKLFKGLVIGFGPRGRPGRMCDTVR